MKIKLYSRNSNESLNFKFNCSYLFNNDIQIFNVSLPLELSNSKDISIKITAK